MQALKYNAAIGGGVVRSVEDIRDHRQGRSLVHGVCSGRLRYCISLVHSSVNVLATV